MRVAAQCLLLFAALALTGCREDHGRLQPFTSDGCSLFPDRSLISEADWCACCFEHDIAYWRGGTRDEREAADRELRRCVLERTGDAGFAKLMYEGVRMGGSPYFYNWYRWGYGWPFERKYQPLTPAEKTYSALLLREARDSESANACPVKTP
ncbi:MAG: hypothetical protein AAF270_03225 [Pseudomonadota bacterium]